MGKYTELAENIIREVGGKENIISVIHCITRLRFHLLDESKANDESIKEIEGVATVIRAAGQVQVVIGNHVPEVHKEVCALADIKKVTEKPAQPADKKKNFGQVFLEYIQAIMMPCLSVMTASGILKGLLAISIMTGILAETDGIYMLLDAAGNAIFHFFPIFIAIALARKLEMPDFLGGAIGAAMVYPAIQGIEGFTVLGFEVGSVSYTSTVLPIVILLLAIAPLERWFRKVLPSVIKSFFAPLLTLIIAVPLGYCLIGPAANLIGSGISIGLTNIYGISPLLCGILLAGFWQVFVMTGVHMPIVMVIFYDIIAGNPSPLHPMLQVVCFSQTAVTMAIWLKTKNKDLKNVALPAWISGFFGITEPAIYGITLPRIKYFVFSCIGAALSGAYIGLTGVHTYQPSGQGLFSIAGTLSTVDAGKGAINFVIAIAIGFISSFAITFILYNDKQYPVLNAKTK